MLIQDQWLKATEINGGRVTQTADLHGWRLSLPPARGDYANAQLDDYQHEGRLAFRWGPGTRLTLRARFSRGEGDLIGTAGFGFWNAPFGPGTGLGARLPRAVWFFHASPASNLPLAPFGEAGNGWFASTIDARPRSVLGWAAIGLPTLLLNQISGIRRLLWPALRRDLGISFERVPVDMRQWHTYEISWRLQNVLFGVDGQPLFMTPFSPRGPLGFVMWIDNQALVVTPRGRVSWKTEAGSGQSVDIADFQLRTCTQ